MHNIITMHSILKNKILLKILPFYSEEIISVKKKRLTNKKLWDAVPFPPKRKKNPKSLTKHQIPQNILPF